MIRRLLAHKLNPGPPILHDRMRAGLSVYRQSIVALELDPAQEDYPRAHKNAERTRCEY